MKKPRDEDMNARLNAEEDRLTKSKKFNTMRTAIKVNLTENKRLIHDFFDVFLLCVHF